MASFTRVGLVMAAAILPFVGCSTGQEAPKKEEPSNSELLKIYNLELEALDRLERKREEMIAEYKAEHQPGTTDALKSIGSATIIWRPTAGKCYVSTRPRFTNAQWTTASPR